MAKSIGKKWNLSYDSKKQGKQWINANTDYWMLKSNDGVALRKIDKEKKNNEWSNNSLR